MAWTTANWTGLLLLSYLIGSFPTSYVLGRMAKSVDIRTLGDGNAGASSSFRQLGTRIVVTVWAVALSFIFAPLSLVVRLASSSITVSGHCIGLPVIVEMSHWQSLRLIRLAEGGYFSLSGEEVHAL